jgi:acetyl esterase/lipase
LFKRLDRNRNNVIERHELPTSETAGVQGNAAIQSKLDIAYGEHKLQRLDLYRPIDATGSPTMVYVHGGGWKRGDKRNVGEKATFFCQRGWIFVSVNYRLLPLGQHPVNVNDVARAIAWVHDHATEYGGDPGKLFVMGHSAGAHLAALVSTNPKPLREVGKPLTILKGVIPLDTNAYDLSNLMQSRSRSFYIDLFGEDESNWKDASPAQHVAANQGIPPFLICYSRGLAGPINPERSTRANAFAKTLRNAGIPAEVIDASDRNHGEINAWFGRADDEKVTGTAVRFLEGILDQVSNAGSISNSGKPAQGDGVSK